jgi:hypothetical protein
MSTWRIEDAEEVKEAEEVEDDDSGATESCLARKLASFGMTVQATIHRSEYKAKLSLIKNSTSLWFPHGLGLQFTRLLYPCHTAFIFVS